MEEGVLFDPEACWEELRELTAGGAEAEREALVLAPSRGVARPEIAAAWRAARSAAFLVARGEWECEWLWLWLGLRRPALSPLPWEREDPGALDPELSPELLLARDLLDWEWLAPDEEIQFCERWEWDEVADDDPVILFLVDEDAWEIVTFGGRTLIPWLPGRTWL